MTMMAAALRYLELGFHAIPCVVRDKKPLVPWKDYQTTMPTRDQVETWWRDQPDANVALVLGRGVFAVDLDGAEPAEHLLADAGIALPTDAPRSRTGAGQHVFLSASHPVPDRVGLLTTNGQKPQVDIRGRGIVVVPPSFHPNGRRYGWINPIIPNPPQAPLALLDLIGKSSDRAERDEETRQHGRFWVTDALRGVTKGQRDDTCTRLAGFLLKKGLDPDTVIVILCHTFAQHCAPTFPARDVEKCVRSIARRESVDGHERTVRPTHISDVLDEFARALAGGPAPTIPTPFHRLNQFLGGGFAPGELIFLGARPGVGKTALGLEFAKRAAEALTGAVLIVSREMTNVALARRMVAQDARIRSSALKTASLTAQEYWALEQSVGRLRPLALWLTDDAVSLQEVHDIVRTIADEVPLTLVIVDYLQLMRAPRDIKERRHQVEAVSQGLKHLALQYRTPVLCLSSLSRPPADSRDKPPTLSALRESGELEHDADIILLLHRKYKEEHTTCHVAKNRDGWTGVVNLLFRSEYVAFDESPVQGDSTDVS